MATSLDFIEYVCDQIKDTGNIRYKKMFGEYTVYVNDKPLLLVCNNTVYMSKHESIKYMMEDASVDIPYKGAKERYVLNIDNGEFCREVIEIIEPITPLPKPRKAKEKNKR